MTERVLGPTGSPRRRWTLLLPLVAVLALGLFYVAGAQAIHDHPDRLIQMDRDGHTSTNNPVLGTEDWQNVCPASQPAGIGGCTGDTTADSSSFVTELGDETIYTTGGSKDIQSVADWKHKDGSVPPKDQLLHGFGAREDDLLYFGGDRFATQGTATFGVWFLQGGVAPVSGGTFSGEHKDGDLLLVADFKASGENSAVIIFEWVGDDATGSLQFLAGGENPVDCVGPPAHPSDPNANSEFCATANLVNTNSPWAFQSSSGPANVWLPGLFFEGGIDLEALELEDKCFTNFIIVTRSSNEPNAQLKDFVAGELEECESTTVTTPSAGSNGEVSLGTAVSDTAVITATGVDVFGGTVSFYLCGPTPLSDADYTLCTTGGTVVNGSEAGALNPPKAVSGSNGTATVVSNSTTPTAVGRYCWRAVYSGDPSSGLPGSSDSRVNECFKIVQLQPSMTTAQRFRPNDSATVTVAAGSGDLAGSIQFKLFVNSTTCAGDPAFDSGGINITTGTGSGLNRTVSTNNTTEYVVSGTTFSWLVTYTSTNGGHKNVTATCNAENSSITISNGGTFNTP